ncbi:hypothetical protein [Mycobacterium marinum]|uniref:hypothetical protein n=1 Tax=Mycobacterium marinum TaxID=1781 RepID=UPI001921948F|nr:hypothetical protein [Mycobacterium marinum]QQW33205.1 hypothetical protein HXW97_04655 [Mycobacterium marinum]
MEGPTLHEPDQARDPLEEAFYRCAEYGGGREVTWHVPEDAAIRPGCGPSIWDGLSIRHWVHD